MRTKTDDDQEPEPRNDDHRLAFPLHQILEASTVLILCAPEFREQSVLSPLRSIGQTTNRLCRRFLPMYEPRRCALRLLLDFSAEVVETAPGFSPEVLNRAACRLSLFVHRLLDVAQGFQIGLLDVNQPLQNLGERLNVLRHLLALAVLRGQFVVDVRQQVRERRQPLSNLEGELLLRRHLGRLDVPPRIGPFGFSGLAVSGFTGSERASVRSFVSGIASTLTGSTEIRGSETA